MCQSSQVQTQRNLKVEMQSKSLVELTLKAAGKKQSDFILSLQPNYFHIESVHWGFKKWLLQKELFHSPNFKGSFSTANFALPESRFFPALPLLWDSPAWLFSLKNHLKRHKIPWNWEEWDAIIKRFLREELKGQAPPVSEKGFQVPGWEGGEGIAPLTNCCTKQGKNSSMLH